MAVAPLAGKKAAVVVESQYISGEIKIYQERLAGYGATVDLVSRLWGQPPARFYSTVEPGVVDQLEWLEVTKDFDDVNLGAVDDDLVTSMSATAGGTEAFVNAIKDWILTRALRHSVGLAQSSTSAALTPRRILCYYGKGGTVVGHC